jgi:hypothetical protein
LLLFLLKQKQQLEVKLLTVFACSAPLWLFLLKQKQSQHLLKQKQQQA